MVELRAVVTDADYEAWRQVRLAVLPHERAPTVEELRAMARPGRTMLLAELDGVVAGHGMTDRSDREGRVGLIPRVLPAYRRRGVGTALLRALEPLALATGRTIGTAFCDDEGSVAFAARFGFTEVDRQVEQLRPIGAEPRPAEETGFTIVTVAQRPELWAAAYEQIGVDGMKEMAVNAPMQVSLEQWEQEWINTPEAAFLALDPGSGEIVGLASVMLDPDHPERAEQGFTTVRRSWRGRSVASTLKRMTFWWAAKHGITEIYTWTQRDNDSMRRVNEHLGFTYGLVSVTVEAALPLAALA
jgi:GNAT superfamily N-acetyltransferase